MESYTALRRSSFKKDYSKFTIVVAICIIAYSLYKMDLKFALLGAVAIYVTLYSKDVIIDEKGMTTHYHAIFYNRSRTYAFSDFNELRVQRTGGPEIIIGFVRKGMNTNCLFTSDDGEGVIRLATEHNPRIAVREIRARRRPGF